MSTDLDQRLAATLRHRAGGDVDPTPIVARARRRGRRLRLRRRVLAAGVVTVACATVAALVMVLPGVRTPNPALPPETALALPGAPGEPGAADRPELVGTDPGVLHFTTENLISGAFSAVWRAGRGTESVEFRGETGQARFVLARSAATLDGLPQTLSSQGQPGPPADVRVGDRPGVAWSDPSGEARLWFVRWQPGDGLWAQLDIYAATRDEATAVAGRVRFDGARRCAVPFRLRVLPPGGRLLECSVMLGRSTHGVFAQGSLVLGDGSGRWLTVRAQPVPGRDERVGDLVAGPYRARRQGGDVLEMFVAPCAVEVFLAGWGSGYTEPDGLAVLGGYQPAGDLARSDTW